MSGVVTVTVVTEFDAMSQNAEEEERLWSAYVTAENNKHRLDYLTDEAWRNHVKSRSSETSRLWQEATDRWDNARELAKQAYAAWVFVAYPLHGWSLPDEDESSS